MKGWTFYPVWGLQMVGDDIGLDSPIFGDATIVSQGFIARSASPDARASAILSGAGFRELLQAEGITNIESAPLDRMIEMPPGAFIAVRRTKPDDAIKYADSIRALLSSSAVLTGGQTKGFAMTPNPMYWAAIPEQVKLNSKGLVETQYKIFVNNFIHFEPILVSHKLLADSWNYGIPIRGTWTLSKNAPLSAVLVGNWNSKSKLRQRIRDSAVVMARAMESTDTTISSLFSVVALELLLKDRNSDFREMEELAKCIITGTNGQSEVSTLISHRHKIAHEAKAANEKGLSRELMTAWVIIQFAAMVAVQVSSTEEFLAHLRSRVLARRVAQDLRRKNRSDLADEVERVATFINAEENTDDTCLNEQDQGLEKGKK